MKVDVDVVGDGEKSSTAQSSGEGVASSSGASQVKEILEQLCGTSCRSGFGSGNCV